MAISPLRLQNFLPYRLSFTSNAVSEMIASQYQETYGLTAPEWRVIAVIAEAGGASQLEIRQITRMDKVTVSRAAMALAERKLLDRQTNPADKRSHLLTLTKAGAKLYASIVPRATEMEQSIFSCLSSKERTTLMRILRRIDDHVDLLSQNGGIGS
jgi:DNA-binding MarR family transcriptional regulator